MLHWWLLPALAILAVAIIALYLAVKYAGGPGFRGDGQIVVDKPVDEDNL
jgi:hypothetical protein